MEGKDLKVRADFCLGEWVVRPQRRIVERGDETVHLTPKSMSVFECLAAANGAPVSRSDLFDAAWPGGEVSDDSLTQCIAELRKAFGDSARHSEIIETIPKMGFRLIPAVKALEGSATVTSLPSWLNLKALRSPGGLRRNLVIVLAVLAIAAISVIGFQWSRSDAFVIPPLAMEEAVSAPEFAPPPRSIAVLPFVNLSSEPTTDYFADGLADMLLHTFAQVKGLVVIARTSSFSFRDARLDARLIGRQLNVATLLEGSVQYVQGEYRIIAQLIETQTGSHLKSLTFRASEAAIFQVQDDIAAAVLEQLKGVLMEDPALQFGHDTVIPLAQNHYLQGVYHWKRGTPESVALGLQYFEKAISTDPEFAMAYVGIADTLLRTPDYEGIPQVLTPDARVQTVMTAFPQLTEAQRFERAERALATALALDDHSSAAYASRAYLSTLQGDLSAASADLRKALELNPNNASAWYYSGKNLALQQRWQESLVAFKRALVLDPVSIPVLFWTALYQAQTVEYEEAIELFYRIRELDPGNTRGNFHAPSIYWEIASVLETRGRYAEAAKWLEWEMELEGVTAVNLMAIGAKYAVVGDAASAQLWIDRALLRPDMAADFSAQLTYFFLLLELGDLVRAEELLNSLGGDDSLDGLRTVIAWLSGQPQEVLNLLDSLIANYGERSVLYGIEPMFTANGGSASTLYVWALSETQQWERAEQYGMSVEKYLESLRQQGWRTASVMRSEAILALARGQKELALTAFESAADLGWSHVWDLQVVLNGNELLAGLPRYEALIVRMQAHNAAQLLKLQQLHADISTDLVSRF